MMTEVRLARRREPRLASLDATPSGHRRPSLGRFCVSSYTGLVNSIVEVEHGWISSTVPFAVVLGGLLSDFTKVIPEFVLPVSCISIVPWKIWKAPSTRPSYNLGVNKRAVQAVKHRPVASDFVSTTGSGI
jgi:hypothetical protein